MPSPTLLLPGVQSQQRKWLLLWSLAGQSLPHKARSEGAWSQPMTARAGDPGGCAPVSCYSVRPRFWGWSLLQAWIGLTLHQGGQLRMPADRRGKQTRHQALRGVPESDRWFMSKFLGEKWNPALCQSLPATSWFSYP